MQGEKKSKTILFPVSLANSIPSVLECKGAVVTQLHSITVTKATRRDLSRDLYPDKTNYGFDEKENFMASQCDTELDLLKTDKVFQETKAFSTARVWASKGESQLSLQWLHM